MAIAVTRRHLAQALLVATQLIALVLSAGLVLATFAPSATIQKHLQSYAIQKVESLTEQALSATEISFTQQQRAEHFRKLKQSLVKEEEQLEEMRRRIAAQLVTRTLQERCTTPCNSTNGIEGFVDKYLAARSQQLRLGQKTAEDFIRQKYDETLRALTLDLRRFGLVNLVALGLMLGLVLFRHLLDWRFFAFSLAMTGYTGWASYGYFYRQNWALTILFQDWAALAYQSTMLIVALLLADWLFLRGRITRTITNAIISAAPC